MSQFKASSEFAKLLAGGGEVDLVQFMLELAGNVYPNLDRVGCLLEIDRLGVACADHAHGAPCLRERLSAISKTLYDAEGFHGNRERYYEPQNSYLNEVLARHTGIPISLGILYMAVAARAGVRMFGVNTPGHFVVGCASAAGMLFVDPFNNGDVLDQCGCKRRIQHVVGNAGTVADHDFCAAAPLDIAARVLRNLKAAYAMQECWSGVLRVQERLTALLPNVAQERRDLGLMYLRMGEPVKALRALEGYVHTCDSPAAQMLEPSLQAARRMIAELN